MPDLIHELLLHSAEKAPQRAALAYREVRLDYGVLAGQVEQCCAGLMRLGVQRSARVAVYLEKRPETVIAIFGAAAAGAVFVPVNPLLKPEQVAYILKDCNVSVLVTSSERLEVLAPAPQDCPELSGVVVVGAPPVADLGKVRRIGWDEAFGAGARTQGHRVIDTDMAAILYTSGSTGKPKGVVLSHRNMVAGARSVA